MAPPLSKNQEETLYDLYYKKYNMFGRDKLFGLIKHLDLDISRRQIDDWLKRQETHQLYFPTKLTKNIQSTILNAPLKQVGMDLVDMSNYEYNGYKYILTCIDLFNKMTYAKPLLNKTDTSVVNALESLLKGPLAGLSSIRSDNGTEFKNAKMKHMLNKYHVKQVFSLPSKPQSNGNIERFNRTLKGLIRKALRISQSDDWPKLLPILINNYNSSVNDVTKLAPNDITLDSSRKILKHIKHNITKRVLKKRNPAKPLFQVGDTVRIKLDSEHKDKSGVNWSSDLYTIVHVTKPRNNIASINYTLRKGTKGQIIKKIFYNADLQYIPSVHNKINVPHRYEIRKIVKPLIHNKLPHYEVAWKGYPDSENTYEPRKELMKDIPKVIKRFESEHEVEWYDDRVRWKE